MVEIIDEYIQKIDKDAQHYMDLVRSNNNGFGFLGNGEENCMNYAKKQKLLAIILVDYKRLLEQYEVDKMGDFVKRDDYDLVFEQMIKELKSNYDEAKRLSFISNPMGYALYQAWKKYDKKPVTRGKE